MHLVCTLLISNCTDKLYTKKGHGNYLCNQLRSYKTEKSSMHHRADFWSNFWEVSGFWSKLLRSCHRSHCVTRSPHKGNFSEVWGQLLKITPWNARKRVLCKRVLWGSVRKRDAHLSANWKVASFRHEGSSLFPPFLSHSGVLLGTFTDSQSTHLQSTRLQASDPQTPANLSESGSC